LKATNAGKSPNVAAFFNPPAQFGNIKPLCHRSEHFSRFPC
jgi:hypothetical protein